MFTLIGQYDRRIDPNRTQLSVTRPDTMRAVERQDMPKDFGRGAQSYQPPKRQPSEGEPDDAATVSLEALRVNAVARLGQIDTALLERELAAAEGTQSTANANPASSANRKNQSDESGGSLAARAASAYQTAAGNNAVGNSRAPMRRNDDTQELKAERMGLRSLIPRIDALLASEVTTVTVPRGESFSQAVERAFQELETDE